MNALLKLWRLRCVIFSSVILFWLVAVMATGCGPDSGAQTVIEISGSSTLAPLMAEIAKRYRTVDPQVNVQIRTGGSSRGIKDVGEGVVDIGMSSRVLTDSEKLENVCHIIARDGIGILVNKGNQVSELSDRQIVDIFTGKMKNWSEVGGLDAPIQSFNRIKGTSELELFKDFFQVSEESLSLETSFVETLDCLDGIAKNENAVTYVSVGASALGILVGNPVKLLPLRGVLPSIETVESGEYPLSRPLILITRKDPGTIVKKFVDYALSAEVTDLVRVQFPPEAGLE